MSSDEAGLLVTAVRSPLPATAAATGIIAVLRGPEARAYKAVVAALVDAGLTCIELTMTTPGTLDALPELRREFPNDVQLGVGTVVDDSVARTAIDGGADFLVTPTLAPSVADVCITSGTPLLCGALTPSEVFGAWQMGAAAVKVFPASAVGPGYLRDIHGPFPHIALMPSGGVTLETIHDWISAGSVAVSLGGPLIGGAFKGEPLAELSRRTRSALARAAEARTS